MIITVLANKYRIGSHKGITAIEEPNILARLNQIICWKSSHFPYKERATDEDPYVEDTEFLGPDPELVPGSMFIVKGGQIIAVENKDKLVLVMSETGPLALKNLYDNEISLEFDLKFNYWGGSVVFEEKELKDIPSHYESYTVPYNLMMIFKNNFLLGRSYSKDNLCLEVTLDSDNYVIPPKVYIQDWSISYDPIIVDPEQAPDMAKELIAWFYNNFEPVRIDEPKESQTNN
jgi:hypothetical protein